MLKGGSTERVRSLILTDTAGNVLGQDTPMCDVDDVSFAVVVVEVSVIYQLDWH